MMYSMNTFEQVYCYICYFYPRILLPIIPVMFSIITNNCYYLRIESQYNES